MSTPYEELASNTNRIAGTNVASGMEPLAIGTRKRLSGMNSKLQLSDMGRQNRYRDIMRRMQQDKIDKDNEFDAMDMPGFIPGVGNIIGGVGARDKAGQMNNYYDQMFKQYGPAR